MPEAGSSPVKWGYPAKVDTYATLLAVIFSAFCKLRKSLNFKIVTIHCRLLPKGKVMRQILITAVAAICLILSCTHEKKTVASKKTVANPTELNGTWELNYISGSNTSFGGLYPGKKPQIVFDVSFSRVSGNTGCNSFSGPVSIDGSKISFNQPLAITKMLCPGEGEALFLEALKKINLWAVTDASTLNLIMGDIALMRFTRVR